MTTAALKSMDTDRLVQQFADLAIQQDRALLEYDNRKVTRLYWKLKEIEDELKARPGDQRTALTTLYAHSNMQVRLKAAISTLAVAPKAARAQLEAISASGWQPQAGDAGMSLWALDYDDWKPS
jgi:cytochrome c oxidase assembly protein Cox11